MSCAPSVGSSPSPCAPSGTRGSRPCRRRRRRRRRGRCSVERLDAADPLTFTAAVDGADGHRRQCQEPSLNASSARSGHRCPAVCPAERRLRARPASSGVRIEVTDDGPEWRFAFVGQLFPPDRRAVTGDGHGEAGLGCSWRGAWPAPPWSGCPTTPGPARRTVPGLRATVLPPGGRAVTLPARAAAPAQ